MKVWLLYENSETDVSNSGMNKNEIIQDLNLEIIFKAMARNDKFIYKMVRNAMLNSLTEKRTVLYRQGIMNDCINYFDNFLELYQIITDTMEEVENYNESTKRMNSHNVSNAASVLHSLELLNILVVRMEKLKGFLDTIEMKFNSRGMRAFYDRLLEEYSVEFVEKIKSSIHEMNFLTEGGQITFSAVVGQGLKSKDIIINDLSKAEFKKKKAYTEALKEFYYKMFRSNVIVLQDDKLSQAAREMEAAGLVHIMKLYQNFIKDMLSYFENLRSQIAFYIGCANLHNRLTQLHIPVSMPYVNNEDMKGFKFRGLYDMSMAIYNREQPVTNDLETEDLLLFLITGANQGGKSTYLRSIGIAQILMQCGMFVPADYYCSSLCRGIYTHFTRREDTAMNSGKLDEELSRMNRIIHNITPGSMLLMNESFATTTEREGSVIASDIVKALYEHGVRILMVTHLFEFTKYMYEHRLEQSMFLSAQRLSDGTRTFKILEQEPERTSYGLDLYDNILGNK